MKYIFHFTVFPLILLCSCISNKQSKLEQALVLAGENKTELEKVLKRYSLDPADSLKYRAALFLIENMPGYLFYRPFRLFHHVTLSSENRYRYVRYEGPEESFCNVAEIQFFSDSLLLRGKIIGTPGSWQNDGSHEYTNAFDGSTETSFDHNTPSDGWTGLDLGQPQKITEIVYSPRNHDNYIKKGDNYELFISERKGWNSLGIQTATSDSLLYENVPVGRLFYLKNHSGGNQERPFIMEDGRVIFI